YTDSFFSHRYADHRYLHSFPTRRSSDLILLGLGGVALLIGKSALTSVPGLFVSSLAVVMSALSWSAGVVYSRRSHLSGHPLLLRSEEHTSELQSLAYLVCRLLLEKKK